MSRGTHLSLNRVNLQHAINFTALCCANWVVKFSTTRGNDPSKLDPAEGEHLHQSFQIEILSL